MRTQITLVFCMTFLFFLLMNYQNAHTYSGTPPTNRTGAPGQNTCTSCHSSGGDGTVEILLGNNISSYEAGTTYDMSVTIMATGKERFGFSMVAYDGNNQDVGTWIASGPNTQVYSGGRYMGHKNAPRNQSSPFTYTFQWIAPEAGTGEVTFYIGAVAANDNGGSGNGDQSIITSKTITENAVVPETCEQTITSQTMTTQAFCEQGTPDLALAEESIVYSGDGSEFAIEWYEDADYTVPYMEQVWEHSGVDNCGIESDILYAKAVCLVDNVTFYDAGTLTIVLYPKPQMPTIEGSCSYTILPACPNDVLSVTEIADKPAGTAAGTIDIEVVSGIDNSNCSSQTFAVPFAACPNAKVKVKVLLEGIYNGNGMMSTALNEAGFLAKNQPYNKLPWNYEGTESVDNFASNIAEWLLLELRAEDDQSLVARQAVLLRNDGIVVDVNGNEEIDFQGVDIGKYFIVIRSRHHLDVMNSSSISLPNTETFDFTTSVIQATGEEQLTAVESNLFALRAGDITGDGTILIDDLNIYFTETASLDGYFISDLSMDNAVTVKDFNLFVQNRGVIGSEAIRYE